MTFTENKISVPTHDCDIVLEWPGGQKVTIQIRPSNADVGGYAGSLDILLPNDRDVTLWEGDEMTPSRKVIDHEATKPGAELYRYQKKVGDPSYECNRIGQQIVTSMDDAWYNNTPIPVSPKPENKTKTVHAAILASPDKDDKLIIEYAVGSPIDGIAVQGKVMLTNIDNDGLSYRSPVLENPTWLQVAMLANKMILATGDKHHRFLEGLICNNREENGIPIWEFSMGS